MHENELAVFVSVHEPTGPNLDLGGFENADEHEVHAGGVGQVAREVRIDFEEFGERWDAIVELVRDMFKRDEGHNEAGLRLDSIEAGLALTGKGKLAFIAEASASASITATFKRRAE